MFKFQSPPKYSPFDAKHLLGHFFPLLKTVFSTAQNSRFCCHLVLLLFFFHSSTSAKCFPLRTFFHQGKQKGHSEWDRVDGESGVLGVLPYWPKNAEHSKVWAGELVNHPWWDGKTSWKSLQKNSLKPNAASHNNTSWYIDADGYLGHSPSGGSLYYKGPTFQKISLCVCPLLVHWGLFLDSLFCSTELFF